MEKSKRKSDKIRTTYYEETQCTSNDNVAEQILHWQRVVDENTCRLDCINTREKEASQDVTKYNKEITQRFSLVVDYGSVIDDLQILGAMQKKKHELKEQLSGPSEEDRSHWKDMHESVAMKIQNLTSEIKDVTRELEEARALYKAQSSSSKLSIKPKGNQAKRP